MMGKEKLEAFANQKYLNLETFKKDGTGVATPLWFAEKDGTIYVYTLADAWKVKRVRNNPRVRIAPCDIRGKLKGDWAEAQARIVKSNDEEQLAHQLLDKKYGWQKKIGNLLSGFRNRQRTVIAITV
jgi:PPOX class probable F420-dependent enzyme